ncbi:MAG: AraC family transcriptional regulator [Gemmatimonadaceae bacterium]
MTSHANLGATSAPVAQVPATPAAGGAATARSFDGGGIRFSELEFQGGLILPLHYHERACISIVTAGAFAERVQGHTHDCTPDTVLLKPAGVPHVDRVSRSGSRQMVIEPEDETIAALGLGPALNDPSLRHMPGVATVGMRMCAELRVVDAATLLSLQGMLLSLCSTIVRHQLPRRRDARPWLLRTAERLRHELHPGPTMKELARDAGFHPGHVARCFRSEFGVSMGTYSRNARLRWAAEQLQSTALSISEIAIGAGFSDQAHFTRLFGKAFAATPSCYRAATRRSADVDPRIRHP